MKYFATQNKNQGQIQDLLKRLDTKINEKIDLLLSAIYFCDTAFAGDLLIEQFKKSEIENKKHLTVLFIKYYQMHRTTYRIPEALELLSK